MFFVANVEARKGGVFKEYLQNIRASKQKQKSISDIYDEYLDGIEIQL